MKAVLKQKTRKGISLLLVVTMLVSSLGLTALAAPGDAGGQPAAGTPELKLWYNQPASQTSRRGDVGSSVPTTDDDIWQKNTLPIGNGDLGANVYGEIGIERLTLNEKTLWTGGPSESRPNYIGGNVIDAIDNQGNPYGGLYGERLKTVQDLFLQGKTAEAVAAAGKLIGEDNGNYGYYAPWGELNIAYDNLATVTEVNAALPGCTNNGTDKINTTDFTFSGNWYTWNDGVHHGPGKVETTSDNTYFTYSFTVPAGKTGTLELFSHTGGGVFTLEFTQKPSGFNQDASDATVSGGLLKSYSNLVPGNYTIKGTRKSGKVNLDYVKLTCMNEASNYQRWLSLDNALSGVEFSAEGVDYTREYFVSHPDNVVVAHLTASTSTDLTVTLPKKMITAATTVAEGNDTLKLCGQLTDNQEKFASFLKAVPGAETTVSASGDHLTITGTEVTLYFSAATDYAQVYPTYRSGETDAQLAARVKKVVDAAAAKGYAAVKTAHLADYKSLYDRMTLNVGQDATQKPTDDLIVAYKNGTASVSEQRLLEVMIFQFGRYLTISSSREDSILPANLQGVWNNRANPPWMSDYHTNVNLQMNYWPTYVTNLAECADSLVRLTESFREPGRVTAHIYAGIESTPENPENGFMAHTQTTPYGYTTPGWSFDWGWSPAAIAWLIQNVWEYYEYTGDVEYMRNNIYPIMREYSRFYDQFLIDKTSGKTADELTASDRNVVLASVPAYSPEHGPRTAGNTYEHSIIWQLYDDTITAAKLLGVDSALVGDENTPGTWTYNQSHLEGPIEVGASGEVKEWYEQYGLDSSGKAIYEDGTLVGNGDQGSGHRHLSHMIGIFPGDLIQTNDEWYEAARVSMNNRGDVNTGWSMAHRTAVWARLRDGNHAHKVLSLMIKNDKFYNNLWDTHAPFQIDGNFGYTAGAAEMLLQSNMGFIDLLPALPDAWANGSYQGMLARGNFVVDATWQSKALTRASITSKNGGECVVSYPNLAQATLTDAQGNAIEFVAETSDKVSFNTAKGATYIFSNIPMVSASVVENAEALRTADDSVTVRWTAQDGESYQIYRQVADGDILPLEGAATTTSPYVDNAAYDALGEIKYYISVDGGTLTDAILVQDLRGMTMLDDKDSRIKYGGTWSNWDNHNEGTYSETVKFIENEALTEADVGQTIELAFLGTGIEVIGGKNTNHGMMSVEIDGVLQETKADFYGTRAYQATIWSVTDLEFGIHTIKLTRLLEKNANMVANSSGKLVNKVEFDAFKVLGGQTTIDPEEPELEINTVGGIEKLWNAGEAVIFTANLENVTWTVESDTPHATTCDYPEHKFSWDSNTKTLTAGLTDEVVTVTATKGDKTASKAITITPKTTVTIIEDSVSSSTGKNPAITWNGNWQSYWGEQAKHHGGSKTESGTSYSYTFSGTGISVFVQKNGHSSWSNNSYTVLLDAGQEGAQTVTCSGYDANLSTSGVNQQKLVEFLNLENGSHTIQVTGSGIGVNLDFIEVYAPNPNAPQADIEALKAAVASCAEYTEEGYTAESWAPLAAALATAGQYLNNEVQATQPQVDAAVTAIESAIAGLQAKPLSAPENVQVLLKEGSAVTLKWDAVTGATGYIVTVNGAEHTTSATTYRITGLESGKTYSFTVKATNSSGASDEVATISAATLDVIAPERVTGLTWADGTLSWTAPNDNVGVTGYKVLVNGVAQTVSGTSVNLSLDTAAQNTLTVVALDAAGNESTPAVLVVAPTYSVSVTNATIEGGKSSFKAGEAVTVTATVPKGSILTGWTAEGVDLGSQTTETTLHFAMPANAVTLAAQVVEKNWSVTTNLTNLTSNAVASVRHGDSLTVTLTATTPYVLPTSVQVTMGGQQLQSPWVTYSTTTGVITVREVTGDVVITAENRPQTPADSTFTADDPFQLPVSKGDSTKLEAEYMELEPGSGSQLAAVYGPNFGNKQLTGFAAGDVIRLYYNAACPGRYTLTLRYKSDRVATAPQNFNWSGANVDTHNGAVPSTLKDGQAAYDSTELRFIVTEAGPGVVEFNADALAADAGNNGGPDLDFMTFTLEEASSLVSGIELDETEATLYLGSTDAEATLKLNATVSPDDANNKTLRWESSDPTVVYVTQDGTVGARSNGAAIITVLAMDGSGAQATAAITVKTRISGEVSISGTPEYGAELVASINQISHQEAKATLTYQWNRNGTPIDGATDRHYTVTKDDIGTQLTVTVDATDPYEGAPNGTTSAPVTATKAKGPDVVASLNAEDCTDGDNGKIIGLNPERTYEYEIVGTDNWQHIEGTPGITEFTNLPAGSYHVRVAETETETAGNPSATLTILAADATGNAIHIGSFVGGVVRADVRKANAGETVTLTVLPDEGYQLVAGTLEVNGGDVAVNADNTFEMPDGEATITAEFEKKVYTIRHSLTDITCDQEVHNHQVTHGDKPIINLVPEDGYELPQVITITLTNSGAPFTYYEYDANTGKIMFTGGITDDLTISGDGIKQSFIVIYEMYGLSALDGPRSVEYHGALSLTITAKEGYDLPATIAITMDGVPFETFAYDAESGVVAIAAGEITGQVVITAQGVSNLPSLTSVTISGGTATVGTQLVAAVTPNDGFPDYRWLREDEDGNRTPIDGATNRTYVIKEADVGYKLVVAATGTSKYGGTVYSDPTAVVKNADVVVTTGVALNTNQTTLTAGGNPLQLIATVSPENASNKAVTWKSSNEEVAFVTSSGAVFGRAPGKATITVTTVNGQKTDTCEVTVVTIELTKTTERVTVGKTITLIPIIPNDLPDKSLTWESQDETIATVDENGVVTGVAAGTTTITVTTGAGYAVTCEVTVRAESSSSGSSSSTTPSTSTTTETREDGATVTTVTKPDGTVTETVKQPDGTKTEAVTTKDGDKTITVTDPEGEELVKIEIPAVIPEVEEKFEDLDSVPWAEEAVNNVAALELVKGTGGNKYDPVAPMTRGSLATVLHRLSQGKTDYEVAFKDVAKNKYYTEGVAWAAKVNVVTGYTADIFAPDDIITREQLAVMLARYAKLIGMDTTADETALDQFVDADATGDWAIDGVAWCVEQGLLKGKGQNNLDPTAEISRAEVAVLLDRFIVLIK